MITKEGINSKGQTNWTLHVPEEHCKAGLEVLLFSNAKGLVVGGSLITWEELGVAKERAESSFYGIKTKESIKNGDKSD